MSDQPIPKVFLPVIGLGRRRGYFPVKGWNRWGNLALSFLLFVGAFLVFVYGLYSAYMAARQHGPVLIDTKLPVPLGVAVILFLFGLLAGWSAYANWNKAVVVYERGFAYNDRKGLQVWRWEDIASLAFAITRHSIIGIYTGTTHRCTISNFQNRRLVLSDSVNKVDELEKHIDGNIFPRLYAHAAGLFNAGQTVVFGPVSISKAGMDIGKKIYRWKDVKDVSINNGVFKVSRKEGGWFNGDSTVASVIPNMRVLLTIIQQVVSLKAG